jgi:hypothetical protein
MSKILKRLTSQIKAKGYSEGAARAIAISAAQTAGNLKKGSTEPTPQGVKRGNMTAGERAKDRASKYSGKHKESEYSYNKKTNMATLKKKK